MNIQFGWEAESLAGFLERTLNETTIATNYAQKLGDALSGQIEGVNVSVTGSTLTFSQDASRASQERTHIKFIDLKPGFRNSSKARPKRGGGWYLIVPMRQSAQKLKAEAPRSLWDQMQSMQFGETGALGDVSQGINYLAQAVQKQFGADRVNPYNFKSSNITRVAAKSGNGTRGQYIAFRTVSDKSPNNSWVIERYVQEEDNYQPSSDIGKVMLERIQQFNHDSSSLLGG